MRRRKLLISIGALGAGGTAAFGTEAFTSVEAERSVDVEIADDSSAFLAIQPLSGNNANDYVSTEDDDTVALDFDGDDETSGSGVNQDAVTQVEDLFKIINQGTQPTSVFFEDDSDAVTFRVTRSTDTSTEGQGGQSLEGEDNSVELDTGEQVAVGITVDTLNNQVSGELITDVTIRAESGASAPDQSIPQPQYVVTSNAAGGSSNEFTKISAALAEVRGGESNSDDQEQVVIGVDGGLTNSEIKDDGSIDIDVAGVTLTGFNGTPTLETGDNEINVDAAGVTVRNLEIDTPTGGGGGPPLRKIEVTENGNEVTLDGLSITVDGASSTAPVIFTDPGANDATIQNCDITGSAMSLKGGGSVTVVGNDIEDPVDEGIFSFGTDLSGADFTVEDNRVRNAGKQSDIKFDLGSSNQPDSINGQTDKQNQIESLLNENDIFAARIGKSDISRGTKVTSDSIDTGRFGSGGIQEAINSAVETPDGVTLVEKQQTGPYGGFQIPEENSVEPAEGFLLSSTGAERPVIGDEVEIKSSSNQSDTPTSNATIEGLRFEGPDSGPALGVETGGSGETNDDLTFRDNEFVASDIGVDADNIKNSTFTDNLFTVAQNKTAIELLSLGNRTIDDKNGSNVRVKNNDFQTPGNTELEGRDQSSNAIEFGPDSGEIKDNNFNVNTDEGVKVLIGQFNGSINGNSDLGDKKTSIDDENTGVSSDEVELSPLNSS